jgi:ribosome-binding factor A
MTSGRMRRVDEAIRQVIGEVVAGELKDPRVGFVTVTDVRTSADLSHARVYVSVLGNDRSEGRDRSRETLPFGQHPRFGQREATLAGLHSAHGYLQRRVASELRLKRTPTLSFLYDDTTDRAMRLEELLSEPEADADG